MLKHVTYRLLFFILSCSFCIACTHYEPPPYTGGNVTAPKPYPTMDTRRWLAGSGQQTTIRLPNILFNLDMAVHPTEQWPVLGVVQGKGLTDEPNTGFVRAYNPEQGAWGPALQIDVGESTLGPDRFARVNVAVQGNRTIHAVWGSTDTQGDIAALRTWTSSSTDYGTTWTDPVVLTKGCQWPLDMASTVDGQLVVLLNCVQGDTAVPAVIVRQAGGTWLPRQWIPVPNWYGASGAVVVRGAAQDARAVVMLTGPKPNMAEGTVYIATKYLINIGDGWEITQRSAQGQYPVPDRFRNATGTAFDRIQDGIPYDEREGIIFSWTDWDAGRVYTITSLDAGTSWSNITPVVYYDETNEDRVSFATPIYDPLADRLVMIWTCCTSEQFNPQASATQYASWSVPGDAEWHPNQLPGTTELRIPLAFNARVAFTTASAQTANSRTAWVGWVEAQQELNIRSVDLNTIIPVQEYPIPTPRPAPSIP